jgi:glucose/arabinose dehydrogenase
MSSTWKELIVVNTKRRYSLLLVLLALGLSALLVGLSGGSGRSSALAGAPRVALAPHDGTEPLPPNTTIETLLSNMTKPIAMAFDPAGRLFYTEKETGNVRLFASGLLQGTSVIHYAVDGTCSERGLLGIAIDPNFNANHYIYVYYTFDANPGTTCEATENRVARFVENNGVGSGSVDIFTLTQTAGNHNGGNIHFGPDGKLYISVGDNADAANAQNVTVKNGKMHRINGDGSIPTDNPVFTQTGALPSLYAMGLRNTFDFTFDPLVSRRIFASENGPNCDDEMNRIEARYNYGWRASYPCDDGSPSIQYNTIPPLWYVPTAQCCIAPTGIAFYTGNQIPEWRNHLFMATYNNSQLRHFYLDAGHTVLTATNVVQGVSIGTDLETGPDGALWYIQGGGYSAGTLKRIAAVITPTPVSTNTPTRTATRTNTPQATPTPFDQERLIGHVTWQDRPSQPSPLQSLPITLTLHWNSGGSNFDFSATTDQYGFFTVTVGLLPNGAYTWRAKGPLFLATSGPVNIADVDVQVEMGLQRGGDANSDNCIGVPDFNILKGTFGKSAGMPGYDPRADFNGDDSANLVDFNRLKINFGQCGAPPVNPGG